MNRKGDELGITRQMALTVLSIIIRWLVYILCSSLFCTPLKFDLKIKLHATKYFDQRG